MHRYSARRGLGAHDQIGETQEKSPEIISSQHTSDLGARDNLHSLVTYQQWHHPNVLVTYFFSTSSNILFFSTPGNIYDYSHMASSFSSRRSTTPARSAVLERATASSHHPACQRQLLPHEAGRSQPTAKANLRQAMGIHRGCRYRPSH